MDRREVRLGDGFADTPSFLHPAPSGLIIRAAEACSCMPHAWAAARMGAIVLHGMGDNLATGNHPSVCTASARAQGRSARQAPRSTPRHDDGRLHAAVEGLHGLLRRCRRALHLMRLAAPPAHLLQAVTSR